jgi:hypothetical protein
MNAMNKWNELKEGARMSPGPLTSGKPSPRTGMGSLSLGLAMK